MILAAQIRGNGMMVVESLLPRLQLPPFIPLAPAVIIGGPVLFSCIKKGEWLSKRPRMV